MLGGYGAFGGRVAERLARGGDVELIIAGRSLERALTFAERLSAATGARIEAAAIDAGKVRASELRTWKPSLLINASGPYQGQDYGLARACIAAGAHYIDLADAREFVTGIVGLDEEARGAGVLVVSGASTVPAVSAAVLDAAISRVPLPEAVTVVISPGNSFDPGLATTQSILGGLGKPFKVLRDSRMTVTHGWQGARRVTMPGLGERWVGDCNVPDLDLLPQRYPGLKTVRVQAGLEVGPFHLGLWLLSWLVRAGLLRRPERLAGPLLALKHRLGFLGSDRGGMTVTLEGRDQLGRPARCDFHLVAGSGDGPFIPATPAVILARKLLAGDLDERGAMPCLGLLSLVDFLQEVADLDIVAGFT